MRGSREGSNESDRLLDPFPDIPRLYILGGKNVLNPALARLRKRGRGGDRCHERPQSAENDEAAAAAIAALGRMVDWGINHPRVRVAC